MTHDQTAKHIGDAIAIPGGLFAVIGNWLGVINGFLTFAVLSATFIWTVYRVIEMHRKLYPGRKR